MKKSRHISLSTAKGFARQRCEIVSVGYGHESDPARYAFDNRAREKFALFQYTLAGEGRFRRGPAGTAATPLPPGRGFLVQSPSDTAYWLPPGATWEFLYVLFVGDLARHHVAQLLARHGPLFDLPANSPPVELLRRLYADAAAGVAPDKFLLSARLYQFLMELYRATLPRARAAPAVDRAVRLIEQDYADAALGVADLARRAGLSKAHFTRLFRAQMGVPPIVYLTQVRVNRATDLLLSTTRPVKEISQTVGYQDYSYFCRVFRQRTGHPPGQVRAPRRRNGLAGAGAAI